MSIVVGEHPIWMTTILVAGSTAHLVVPSEDGVLAAPQLEFAVGRADAAPAQTYPLALVSGEWMVTLTAAQVAALSGVHFARVTDGGRTIAAGYVQYNPGWDGGSSRVVTSSRIIYGGGDGAGTGVSDHGALTGLTDDDHQIYALSDGTRGDFAATSHGHVLADISDYTAPDLSGLVQNTDPRLSDARTPTAHGHAVADVTGLEAALDGKQPAVQPINAQTAAYTLAASDAGKLVTVTLAAAADVTVPSGVFTAGQRVDVLDLGTERITFVAGSGMTLGGTPTLVSRAQYSAHSVVFLSASQAVVVGDLGAE